MKFTLGFSPCPNDTFIFDALVNKKIDTEGMEFDAQLEDIQTLNQWAAEGKLEITKLSFPSFFQNENQYAMLDAGAALGKGVGPLLIAKTMVQVPDIEHCSIAIPGENTTANFLLSFAFPMAKNKVPMLFSEIEDAVLMGKVDMGVIIHENRFTYEAKGLMKIVDLGDFWEQQTGQSIPLGGITISRKIESAIQQQIDQLIKKSIEFAFSNYPLLTDYVKKHSQEMSEDVMRKHIDLYVNDYSIDLKQEGKNAIVKLLKVYENLNGVHIDSHNIFVS